MRPATGRHASVLFSRMDFPAAPAGPASRLLHMQEKLAFQPVVLSENCPPPPFAFAFPTSRQLHVAKPPLPLSPPPSSPPAPAPPVPMGPPSPLPVTAPVPNPGASTLDVASEQATEGQEGADKAAKSSEEVIQGIEYVGTVTESLDMPRATPEGHEVQELVIWQENNKFGSSRETAADSNNVGSVGIQEDGAGEDAGTGREPEEGDDERIVDFFKSPNPLPEQGGRSAGSTNKDAPSGHVGAPTDGRNGPPGDDFSVFTDMWSGKPNADSVDEASSGPVVPPLQLQPLQSPASSVDRESQSLDIRGINSTGGSRNSSEVVVTDTNHGQDRQAVFEVPSATEFHGISPFPAMEEEFRVLLEVEFKVSMEAKHAGMLAAMFSEDTSWLYSVLAGAAGKVLCLLHMTCLQPLEWALIES